MVAIGVIIILGIIGIAVISIIVYIISKLIFDSKINKALADGGNASGKKLFSPVKITMAVAGGLTIALLGLCVCFSLFAALVDSGTLNKMAGIDTDAPDLVVITSFDGALYSPDPEEYIYMQSVSSGDAECFFYKSSDSSNRDVAPYLIVCEYRGTAEISQVEASFTKGNKGSGGIVIIDGSTQIYSISLWQLDYPGTVSVMLFDEDHNEVSCIVTDMGDTE